MIEDILSAQSLDKDSYLIRPKQSYQRNYNKFFSSDKDHPKKSVSSYSHYKTGQDFVIPATLVSNGTYQSQANSIDELCKYQKEGEQFKNLVKDYITKNGDFLENYLSSKGKDLGNLKGVGSIKLEDNAVAALISYQLNGQKQSYMVSNGSGKGFDARVSEFASNYLLDKDAATEYVIVHEMMHAAGYDDEISCEQAVGEFFSQMAQHSYGQTKDKYTELAHTAEIREKVQSSDAYQSNHTSQNYH